MKGKLVALVAVVAVFVMTGCGSKTLTCTNQNNMAGIEMNSTVKVNFKGDKMDDMKVIMEVKVPDEYKDQKQDLIDELKEIDENIKVTETKDGVKAEMTADEDYFKELNIDSTTVTYDELKEAFTKQSYTCK